MRGCKPTGREWRSLLHTNRGKFLMNYRCSAETVLENNTFKKRILARNGIIILKDYWEHGSEWDFTYKRSKPPNNAKDFLVFSSNKQMFFQIFHSDLFICKKSLENGKVEPHADMLGWYLIMSKVLNVNLPLSIQNYHRQLQCTLTLKTCPFLDNTD